MLAAGDTAAGGGGRMGRPLNCRHASVSAQLWMTASASRAAVTSCGEKGLSGGRFGDAGAASWGGCQSDLELAVPDEAGAEAALATALPLTAVVCWRGDGARRTALSALRAFLVGRCRGASVGAAGRRRGGTAQGRAESTLHGTGAGSARPRSWSLLPSSGAARASATTTCVRRPTGPGRGVLARPVGRTTGGSVGCSGGRESGCGALPRTPPAPMGVVGREPGRESTGDSGWRLDQNAPSARPPSGGRVKAAETPAVPTVGAPGRGAGGGRHSPTATRDGRP